MRQSQAAHATATDGWGAKLWPLMIKIGDPVTAGHCPSNPLVSVALFIECYGIFDVISEILWRYLLLP